ncbi:MAG: type II secretion system protein [Candidatus Gracilibacteria bacterium]|nr:type II secretion system protein [Candidatus Gracilibacteria bacterium]
MKQQQKQAFTLVELIIVITILAILATIGFMSYQSYTADARDSNRITSLKEISNGLQIYETKKATLPYPDEQVTTISSGASVISYQGYAGTSLSKSLRSSDIKDPKENLPYTYTISGDKTKYQLLALLENGTSIQSTSYLPVNNAYSINTYTDRYVYTVGDKLGVFLDNTTKAPVQESTGTINLATNTTTYKVVFANTTTNSGVIVGSGITLAQQIQTISNTIATAQSTPVNDGHGFFKGITYNGNGSTQSIIGLGFQPDFIWTKGRNQATGNHLIMDSIRGVKKAIITNGAGSEYLRGVDSFDTSGFSLSSANDGGDANVSGINYVAWCINAPTQFSGTTNNGKAYTGKTNGSWFSMVKHTENGTNTYSTFPHGLTIRPSLIIHKNLTNAGNWLVRYEDGNKLLTLNSSNAATNYDFTGWSNSTSMRSLLDSATNDNIMTYSFASVPGVTKIGTYNGTSAVGNSIDLGFKPAFILIKKLNAIENWVILDDKRLNDGYRILPDSSAIEDTTVDVLDFTNTGFTLKDSSFRHNISGSNYLYLAIAE